MYPQAGADFDHFVTGAGPKLLTHQVEVVVLSLIEGAGVFRILRVPRPSELRVFPDH